MDGLKVEQEQCQEPQAEGEDRIPLGAALGAIQESVAALKRTAAAQTLERVLAALLTGKQ